MFGREHACPEMVVAVFGVVERGLHPIGEGDGAFGADAIAQKAGDWGRGALRHAAVRRGSGRPVSRCRGR